MGSAPGFDKITDWPDIGALSGAEGGAGLGGEGFRVAAGGVRRAVEGFVPSRPTASEGAGATAGTSVGTCS